MFQSLQAISPGFILALILALLAMQVGAWSSLPVSLLALLIGIVLSALSGHPLLKGGINWASKIVLRAGVACLGFRIVFDDLLTLGWQGGVMVVLGIGLTIICGILLGNRLGLGKEFGVLTGSAVAICGASAAMAVSAILPDHKNKERNTSLTIMGITAFSTTAMTVYPLLGYALGLEWEQMAMFLGGSIHDVAQTAGAGYSVSQEVGDLAILTKMIRVACLVPVVLLLALYFKPEQEADQPRKGVIQLPLFLIAFVIFMTLNSMLEIPPIITESATQFSRYALVTAIVAIGLKTSVRDILTVGIKPVVLIAVETVLMALVVLGCILYL